MPVPQPIPDPVPTPRKKTEVRPAPDFVAMRLRPHRIRQRFWCAYVFLMCGVFCAVFALLFRIEPPSRTGWLLSLPILTLLLGHGFGSLFFYSSQESVRLQGRELTIRRTLGPLNRRRKYRLSPRSRPRLVRRWDGFRTEVQLRDSRDRLIRLARGATEAQQRALIQRLNACLDARR